MGERPHAQAGRIGGEIQPLRGLLRRDGYDVELAESGAQALRMLQETPFDLILTDLALGRGTSGTWSPVLKKYVVMARLRPEHAKLGNRVFIEEMIEAVSHSVPATGVAMPFFDPPRKKAWGSGVV